MMNLQREQIIDKFNILWKYDKKTKAWINTGYVDIYSNVTETTDGLVYPKLFETLELIDLNKLKTFKLSSNTNADFYYFYSSDGSITLKYERNHLDEQLLRLEVNSGLLIKKFKELRCAGLKGPKGDKGAKGLPGIPANPEPTYKLNINDYGLVNIKAPVSTPLDTPVSLRLYKNQEKIGEFLIYSDGETIYSFVDGYSLKDDIYDLYIDNGIIYGSFEIDGQLDGHWTFKVRQCGPKGKCGQDGSWFLSIKNVAITDDNIVGKTVIVDIGKEDNNITISKVSVSELVCVSGLIPMDPLFYKFNLLSTNFISVRYMSSNCRDVCKWLYTRSKLSIPDIELPSWTPTECCPSTS